MDIQPHSDNLLSSNEDNSNEQPSNRQLNNSMDSTSLDLFQLLNTHTEEHICHICNKHLNSHKNLNKHIKLHSNIRQYKCSKCDKEYKRSDHLSRHQIVHNDNPTPYECPHCYKQFSMKYHLKSHIENVHNENPFKYQCPQCSLNFPKKSKLLKHQRRDHKEIINKIKCYYPYCCKAYMTQRKLDEHIKLSHAQISLDDIDKEQNEKQVKYYRCLYENCNKIYSTCYNLSTHIKSFHLNDNPFGCDMCGKEFKHKSSLKRHMEKAHLLNNKNNTIKQEKEDDNKDAYDSFEQLMNEFIDENENKESKTLIDAFE